ncbi:50S ribosomal protein L9 [Allopusillimonas ginsengisoli]|uniref:50S ribosomal protein L9 n=1 Tax=Allopusillimonas ginsengisoli TaxID=453575 RepID=UPI00102115D0|nr:50S ribosomal protein L9 [Allopusillimonas ginsengisoli]TEA78415.1 50S ribosomal protein L9 [Allopusillimonas ginsengisoli]
MQVILLEKVVNLGNLGDVVRVRNGYARNYLIPQKIARRATDAALKEFEARRAELEKAQAEKLAAAEAVNAKLAGHTVIVSQKAGVDGRLFGSVTSMDIAAALVRDGFDTVEKAQVRLPDGHLKAVGEYPVQVVLLADVVADITVVVQGEMA